MYINLKISTLITLLLLTITFNITGQTSMILDLYSSYSSTLGNENSVRVIAKGQVAEWVDISGGIETTTKLNTSFLCRADFFLTPRSKHNLELRNQYIANFFSAYQSNAFSAALALAYSQNYFYCALGASHHQYWSEGDIVIEPIHFCYDFEGRIFKPSHHWNIACQLTNITPFLIESLYTPNFILKTNVKVYEKDFNRVDVIFNFGIESAGFSHIISQFNQVYINAGVIWQI